MFIASDGFRLSKTAGHNEGSVTVWGGNNRHLLNFGFFEIIPLDVLNNTEFNRIFECMMAL